MFVAMELNILIEHVSCLLEDMVHRLAGIWNKSKLHVASVYYPADLVCMKAK